MLSVTYCLLAYTLCLCYPATPIHCHSDYALTSNSLLLENMAMFFKYIIINGKQFYTFLTVGSNRSSLVHVVIPGLFPTDIYGKVLEILQIDQDFQNKGYLLWLTCMQWFKPWYGECRELMAYFISSADCSIHTANSSSAIFMALFLPFLNVWLSFPP